MNQNNTTGIYIHIPFCKSKCPYCDFYSMCADNELKDRYLSAVIDELATLDNAKIYDTVYFGGGTPTEFGADRIVRVLNFIRENYKLAENTEITLECNPQSDLFDLFSKVKFAGVNRISIGCQSIHDNELKSLGRLAKINDIEKAINDARKAGIFNISVDLMLGIPQQTKESLLKSLQFFIDKKIPHISCYMLQIEEGTIFQKRMNRLSLPDENSVSELYEILINTLNHAGINQYEISNFAVKGFESKHNLRYWNLSDYYGIGPSAHSLINNSRYYYERDIEKYITARKKIYDGDGNTYDEYIMLQLRLTNGLNLTKLKENYGFAFAKKKLTVIENYVKSGYIIEENDNIKLTTKGMLASNRIIADLL